MQKYRKKPVVVEAIQFHDTPETITVISDFAGQTITVDYSQTPPVLRVETLEGVMTAQPGDWIIKGVKGEIYPCKPDIFEATYEVVPPLNPGDQVRHKRYNYGIGTVEKLSKAGRKAYVRWPRIRHWAYFDVASLEKVEE